MAGSGEAPRSRTTPAPRTCRNCDTMLHGGYCSSCGQKALEGRLTLRQLVGDFLSETFELDGRVPATLIPFFFKPGQLTLEYVSGRRRRYTAPLRLFLGMGVLWVLLIFVQGQWKALNEIPDTPATVLAIEEGPEDGAGESSSFFDEIDLGDGRLGRLLERRIEVFDALPLDEKIERLETASRDVVPTVALVLLPLFTLLLALVNWRAKWTLPEHGIFALHTHAMGLFLVTAARATGSEIVGGLAAMVFGAYVFAALRRAYSHSTWGTLWRWAILAWAFFAATISVFVMALFGSAVAG